MRNGELFEIFSFFLVFYVKKKVSFSSLIKDITICIILTSHSLSLSLCLVSVCLSLLLSHKKKYIILFVSLIDSRR